MSIFYPPGTTTLPGEESGPETITLKLTKTITVTIEYDPDDLDGYASREAAIEVALDDTYESEFAMADFDWEEV